MTSYSSYLTEAVPDMSIEEANNEDVEPDYGSLRATLVTRTCLFGRPRAPRVARADAGRDS